MIDSRSISDLHPCLRRGVNELIRRMKEKGYTIGISSTYRDNEMQNLIYSYGRTIPNPNTANPKSTSTNAKGGQSIHNYRLAFDIFNNVPSNLYPPACMNLAGRIWKDMGGTWGGDFKSVDTPHFEFTGGYSLSALQSGKRLSDNAKMPWEAVTTQIEEAEEVLSDMKVSVNGGPVIIISSILKDGRNHPNLQELAKVLSIKVEYDTNKNLVILTK